MFACTCQTLSYFRNSSAYNCCVDIFPDACDRSRQNGLHTKVSTQGQRHNSNNLLKKIHSSRTGGSLDTATSAQNSILTMKFPWHSKKKATTGSLPDLSQSKDQPHRQPELNRLHMPVQKHRSLSGLLKTRFENLFNNKSQSKQPVSTVTLNKKNCEHTGRMSASFHDLQDKTTGKLKDHVYRQLIEQIMKEDQEIFRLHRPLLEHSLSVPEDDGFAVRQFPQSSQPNLRKQLSLDCDITMVTSQQDISCLSKNSTDVHTAEQINAKLTAANDKCPSSVPLTFTSSESVPCQIREERRDLGPGYQSNKETGRGFNEVCDKPLYKVCDSADITDHWYQQSPVKSQIVGVDSLSPSSSSCLSSSSSSDSEDDWAQTTAQAIKHMQTQLDELNTDNCVQTAGPAGQLADYTALNCNGLTALNNKKLLQQLIEARHRLANTNSPSISDMSSDSTSDDDDDDDAVFQIASICSNDEVDETHKGSLNTPLAMCNGTDSTDETHKGSLTTPLAMCNGTDSTDHQLSQHQAAASLPENIPPKIKNVVEKNTVGATKQGGERCVNTQDDVDHTCQRFYHVFKEQELVELIEKHVDCLHLLESFYDHANWCIIAEKVNVWTI